MSGVSSAELSLPTELALEHMEQWRGGEKGGSEGPRRLAELGAQVIDQNMGVFPEGKSAKIEIEEDVWGVEVGDREGPILIWREKRYAAGEA